MKLKIPVITAVIFLAFAFFQILKSEASATNISGNTLFYSDNKNAGGLSEITAVINYTQEPRNLQFFARDSQDSALVTYSGYIYTAGYDSVLLEVFRNNVNIKLNRLKLNYSGGISTFNIGQKIHSELSEYKFKLYLKSGSTYYLIKTADSIVCGDAYIISGQSNSHPTDAAASYKNEFCRSFGVQTSNNNGNTYNPADTNWGFSAADGAVYSWGGPYNVGVWGLMLQKSIKETYGIPTCIINGGRAGSTIEQNLRNDNNQTDLTSIYGKLLYRVKKSGLSNNIKAVFWYQGEANGNLTYMNYLNNFADLYYSWKENYPGFAKTYLFQTRPCCSEPYASQLREVQRNIPNSFPGISIMSTAGIPNYDGCHYLYYGYLSVADNIFKYVAKNFYKSADTVDILPPDIKAAYYTNSQKNEIALLFNNSKVTSWPSDTLNQSMKNYFYLDGVTGNVASGSISGDTVKLRLVTSSNASKITYLPTVWNHDDSLVYEGPFLRNSRKIGALSFHNFPVGIYPPSTINVTVAVEGYLNTVTNKLNKRDTIKIYLRNNYFPYLKRDSASAVIDSANFTGKFIFGNVPSGTYYLSVKGTNIIETWSKSPGLYITSGAVTNYNFTTSAAQSYGGNMKLKGGKYCIYSSDLNQDGIVDGMDNSIVSNFAYSGTTGLIPADLNGDRIVDAEDINIAETNSSILVVTVTP